MREGAEAERARVCCAKDERGDGREGALVLQQRRRAGQIQGKCGEEGRSGKAGGGWGF